MNKINRYLVVLVFSILISSSFVCSDDSYDHSNQDVENQDNSFFSSAKGFLWKGFYEVYTFFAGSITGNVVDTQDGAIVGSFDLSEAIDEPESDTLSDTNSKQQNDSIKETNNQELNPNADMQKQEFLDSTEPSDDSQYKDSTQQNPTNDEQTTLELSERNNPDNNLSDLINLTREIIINNSNDSDVTDEDLELVNKIQQTIDELSSYDSTIDEINDQEINNLTDNSVQPDISEGNYSDREENVDESDSIELDNSTINDTQFDILSDFSSMNSTGFENESSKSEDSSGSSDDTNLGTENDQTPKNATDLQQGNVEENETTQDPIIIDESQSDLNHTIDSVNDTINDLNDMAEDVNITQEQDISNDDSKLNETVDFNEDPQNSTSSTQNDQVGELSELKINVIGEPTVNGLVVFDLFPKDSVESIISMFVTHNEVSYKLENSNYVVPEPGTYTVTAIVNAAGVSRVIEETFVGYIKENESGGSDALIDDLVEPDLEEETEEAQDEIIEEAIEFEMDIELVPEKIDFFKSGTEVEYIYGWSANVVGPKKIILPIDAYGVTVQKKETALEDLNNLTVFNSVDVLIDNNGLMKKVSEYNQEMMPLIEEKKKKFLKSKSHSMVTGYVVTQDVDEDSGLIPRMFNKVFSWLFDGSITGMVTAVLDESLILELSEGEYNVSYLTLEYQITPDEVNESFSCDLVNGKKIKVVDNMACYNSDLIINSLEINPGKSLLLKNSTLVTKKIKLNGDLHIEGPTGLIVLNGDFLVKSGAKFVLNNSILVMNVTQREVPKLELVSGAKMAVARNSKIINGKDYGGLDSTFQFIVNAKEYKLK